MARSHRYVVYLLVDPRDDRPYYVGSTSAPKARFRQHCDPNSNPTLPVSQRSAVILDSGEVPRFAPLEIHARRVDALVAELFWIDLLATGTFLWSTTKGIVGGCSNDTTGWPEKIISPPNRVGIAVGGRDLIGNSSGLTILFPTLGSPRDTRFQCLFGE